MIIDVKLVCVCEVVYLASVTHNCLVLPSQSLL